MKLLFGRNEYELQPAASGEWHLDVERASVIGDYLSLAQDLGSPIKTDRGECHVVAGVRAGERVTYTLREG